MSVASVATMPGTAPATAAEEAAVEVVAAAAEAAAVDVVAGEWQSQRFLFCFGDLIYHQGNLIDFSNACPFWTDP